MSRANHLLSAGTTNQGARGVAVARIASSKAVHVVAPEASLAAVGRRELPVLLRPLQALHEAPKARRDEPGRENTLQHVGINKVAKCLLQLWRQAMGLVSWSDDGAHYVLMSLTTRPRRLALEPR